MPALLACGLVFIAPDSFASEFMVTYTTPAGDPVINRMHSWILHVEDDAGIAVEGATIEVEGGMPLHDHGLPTKPRITEDLGGGTMAIMKGKLFEKVGVHTSCVYGDFSRFNRHKEGPPAKDSGGWAWSRHGVWDSHIPELFVRVEFSAQEPPQKP